MPFSLFTILLALHASTFITLSGLFLSNTNFVAAAPLPLMAPDYSNNSFGVLTPESVPRSPAVQHGDVMFSRAVPPADFTSHAENADLQNLLNRAGENRDNLKTLSARSSSVKSNDKGIIDDSIRQVKDLSANMLSFQTLLGQLAAENGLAYYCRDDSLQTLLKHAVNITKDSLRYTTIIVGNTPILGPILGPLVFQIKCYLDEILNLSEKDIDEVVELLASAF